MISDASGSQEVISDSLDLESEEMTESYLTRT